MHLLKYQLLPNFGINYGYTVKSPYSTSFRPACTKEEINDAYDGMLCEFFEEKHMLSYERNHSIITCEDHYSMPIFSFFNEPCEKMLDTSWYDLKCTTFVKAYCAENILNMEESKKESFVLVPEEAAVFHDFWDVSDRKSIHWSNSNGYAHSNSIRRALIKATSEIVENHVKMKWWFSECNIYLIDNGNVLRKYVDDKDIFVGSFLIDNFSLYNSYVCMTVICLKKSNRIYMGFGCNVSVNKSWEHSWNEAINSFRGVSWYELTHYDYKYDNELYEDVVAKLNRTYTGTVTMDSLGNFNEEAVFNKHSFYYIPVNNDGIGYTLRVISSEFQPLVSNQFVPFYLAGFNSEYSKRLRKKYRGVPFI